MNIVEEHYQLLIDLCNEKVERYQQHLSKVEDPIMLFDLKQAIEKEQFHIQLYTDRMNEAK